MQHRNSLTRSYYARNTDLCQWRLSTTEETHGNHAEPCAGPDDERVPDGLEYYPFRRQALRRQRDRVAPHRAAAGGRPAPLYLPRLRAARTPPRAPARDAGRADG